MLYTRSTQTGSSCIEIILMLLFLALVAVAFIIVINPSASVLQDLSSAFLDLNDTVNNLAGN